MPFTATFDVLCLISLSLEDFLLKHFDKDTLDELNEQKYNMINFNILMLKSNAKIVNLIKVFDVICST